ncbi:hypothetical protein EMMF5_003312 [Cystobasidiomycetes sp. EMM_F5]
MWCPLPVPALPSSPLPQGYTQLKPLDVEKLLADASQSSSSSQDEQQPARPPRAASSEWSYGSRSDTSNNVYNPVQQWSVNVPARLPSEEPSFTYTDSDSDKDSPVITDNVVADTEFATANNVKCEDDSPQRDIKQMTNPISIKSSPSLSTITTYADIDVKPKFPTADTKPDVSRLALDIRMRRISEEARRLREAPKQTDRAISTDTKRLYMRRDDSPYYKHTAAFDTRSQASRSLAAAALTSIRPIKARKLPAHQLRSRNQCLRSSSL